MSTLVFDAANPIENVDDLIAYFREAEKPEEDWKIGIEHEKFIVDQETQMPLPYKGEKSISALFDLLRSYDWLPVFDQDQVIGLRKKNSLISLEPGGQLELSGAPLRMIEEVESELEDHLKELDALLPLLHAKIIWKGIHPKARREDMAQIPKTRYQLMQEYMPQKGRLGLDMMKRTASIQVNLDFSSEQDMVQKFQVATGLTPFVMAYFANSELLEGNPSGFLSYRSHIWQDTDPDRCGLLDFVFDPHFGYESYIHYALHVPMYFILRDGSYIDALGVKFIDFWKGNASKLKGYVANKGDWANHLTTLFPEIRLKSYLELRMMDCGEKSRILEAAMFWKEALYTKNKREELHKMVMSWPKQDLFLAYKNVPRQGFETSFFQKNLGDYWKQILEICQIQTASVNSFEVKGSK